MKSIAPHTNSSRITILNELSLLDFVLPELLIRLTMYRVISQVHIILGIVFHIDFSVSQIIAVIVRIQLIENIGNLPVIHAHIMYFQQECHCILTTVLVFKVILHIKDTTPTLRHNPIEWCVLNGIIPTELWNQQRECR